MITFPLSDSPYSPRPGKQVVSPATGLVKPQKLNPGDDGRFCGPVHQGNFSRRANSTARRAEYDQVLREVVTEEAELSELPIITGMDFDHTDLMMVLPYGVQAVIDCDARQFSIVESAVTAGGT